MASPSSTHSALAPGSDGRGERVCSLAVLYLRVFESGLSAPASVPAHCAPWGVAIRDVGTGMEVAASQACALSDSSSPVASVSLPVNWEARTCSSPVGVK